MERKLIKNIGKNMRTSDFFVLIVKLNNVKLVKPYPIIQEKPVNNIKR